SPIRAPGGIVLRFSMSTPSFRMPEAWIGDDRGDVRDDVQADIDGGEYEPDRLHDRNVAFRHMVDKILPHAGIDEDDLHDDDADHEECEIEHHDIDDRRDGVGECVTPYD